MRAKHTPGPWQVNQFDPAQVCVVRGCSPIATMHGTPAEKCANALLIAAAPELLDALQGLYEAYFRAGSPLNKDQRHEDRMRLIAARAAINKAIGDKK